MRLLPWHPEPERNAKSVPGWMDAGLDASETQDDGELKIDDKVARSARLCRGGAIVISCCAGVVGAMPRRPARARKILEVAVDSPRRLRHRWRLGSVGDPLELIICIPARRERRVASDRGSREARPAEVVLRNFPHELLR